MGREGVWEEGGREGRVGGDKTYNGCVGGQQNKMQKQSSMLQEGREKHSQHVTSPVKNAGKGTQRTGGGRTQENLSHPPVPRQRNRE